MNCRVLTWCPAVDSGGRMLPFRVRSNPSLSLQEACRNMVEAKRPRSPRPFFTIVVVSDTWSTCTRMNVTREVWATPTSFRRPSTVIGGKAGGKALAAPSSRILPTGPPPYCLHQRSQRPAWAWQGAPMEPRWPPSRRSRKVGVILYRKGRADIRF